MNINLMKKLVAGQSRIKRVPMIDICGVKYERPMIKDFLLQSAERFFFTDPTPELEDLLQSNRCYLPRVMSRGEPIKPELSLNQKTILIDGPTKPERVTIAQQEQAVEQLISGIYNKKGELITKGLASNIGAIIHGGTMWAFIPKAHELAKANNMLSIGVIPMQGIKSMLKVKDYITGHTYKPMDILGFCGEKYGESARLMKKLSDIGVIIGGKQGMLQIAQEIRSLNKKGDRTLMVNLKLDPEELVFQDFQGGAFNADSVGKAISFIRSNAITNEALYSGTEISKESYQTRTANYIKLCFNGSCGNAKKDMGYHKRLLGHIAEMIEAPYKNLAAPLSGGTDEGSLSAFYQEFQGCGFGSAGIIPNRGIDYKLNPYLEHLIIHGEKFGEESKVYLALMEVLLVLGGGNQTDKEVRQAIEGAGAFNESVPIIAVYDQSIGGWSWDSYHGINGRQRLDGVHYFSSAQLAQAGRFLNTVLADIARKKGLNINQDF